MLQLNWLEMQDFGPYKGKHRIDFAPADKGKPVTLIGGQNGAGKTTLLKQFSLYCMERMRPLKSEVKIATPPTFLLW